MFIQTEATPNPATLKFLPGQSVMRSGSADFPSAEGADASPLASRIFAVDGVVGVFLGNQRACDLRRGNCAQKDAACGSDCKFLHVLIPISYLRLMRGLTHSNANHSAGSTALCLSLTSR